MAQYWFGMLAAAFLPLHVIAFEGLCPFTDVTCSSDANVGAMTAENEARRTAAACVGDVTGEN